jgi:cysteine-rich repeat protein
MVYCKETCGDGRFLGLSQDQSCDDGNYLNNDGCSTECKIEKGWFCVLDNSKKSICNRNLVAEFI